MTFSLSCISRNVSQSFADSAVSECVLKSKCFLFTILHQFSNPTEHKLEHDHEPYLAFIVHWAI